MAYNKIFSKLYPNGWKDKPTKTTPIKAEALNRYDEALEHIEDGIDIIDGIVTTLKETVATNTNNITDLQNKTTPLIEELETVKDTLQTVKSWAEVNSSDITDIYDDIVDLENADVVLSNAVENNSNYITDLQKSSDSLTNELGDVQADLSIVQSAVEAIEERVDLHDGDIIGLADALTALHENDAAVLEEAKAYADETAAYTHPTYTARTGYPVSNQTPAFGSTVTISQIVSDATGHVKDATARTIKIPSTLSNGTGTAGLIKTTSTVTSNSGYTPCPVINGVPYYKAGSSGGGGLENSNDINGGFNIWTYGDDGGEAYMSIEPDSYITFCLYCNTAQEDINISNMALWSCNGDGDGGSISLGLSSHKWSNIYATNGTIQTSDRNEKNTIVDMTTEQAEALIYGLKPSTYKMNSGTSGRTHWGMISQDIEELLDSLGWTSLDFAGFIKSPKVVMEKITDENGKVQYVEKVVEGESTYSLRYDEFVAPLIKVVQEQKAKIDSLEARLAKLEAKLA